MGPGWARSHLPEDHHAVPHFLVFKEPSRPRRNYSSSRPQPQHHTARSHNLKNPKRTAAINNTKPKKIKRNQRKTTLIRGFRYPLGSDRRKLAGYSRDEKRERGRDRGRKNQRLGVLFSQLRVRAKGYMSLFSTWVRGCIMRVTDGWLMILMAA